MCASRTREPAAAPSPATADNHHGGSRSRSSAPRQAGRAVSAPLTSVSEPFSGSPEASSVAPPRSVGQIGVRRSTALLVSPTGPPRVPAVAERAAGQPFPRQLTAADRRRRSEGRTGFGCDGAATRLAVAADPLQPVAQLSGARPARQRQPGFAGRRADAAPGDGLRPECQWSSGLSGRPGTAAGAGRSSAAQRHLPHWWQDCCCCCASACRCHRWRQPGAAGAHCGVDHRRHNCAARGQPPAIKWQRRRRQQQRHHARRC